MNEIPAAFIGAVLGALATYIFSELSQRGYERKRLKDERNKIMTALYWEIQLNLTIADAVLAQKNTEKYARRGDWKWLEITPFSDVALIAAMSSGGLAHLPSSMIEPLLQAYTVVIGANHTATKIQYGEFEPNEGEEYMSRVRGAKDMLTKAQEILKQSNKVNRKS